MTDPLNPTEQNSPIEPDVPANQSSLKSNGRFSLLFVGLTFIVALLLGAAIGFGFGRSQAGPSEQVVVASTPDQAVAQADDGSTPAVQDAVAAATRDTAPTPTIMDLVLSDARHVQGSADTPITMIEFSDFK